MFKHITSLLQKIWDTFSPTGDTFLPRAAPSIEEVIGPIDPAEDAILPHELKQLIDSGKEFILLDVRDEWEYKLVRIEGAVSIPLGELLKRFGELSPEDEIVVYCHHGMRSLDAAHLLQQIGFRSVLSMAGGIDRWAKEIDQALQRY